MELEESERLSTQQCIYKSGVLDWLASTAVYIWQLIILIAYELKCTIYLVRQGGSGSSLAIYLYNRDLNKYFSLTFADYNSPEYWRSSFTHVFRFRPSTDFFLPRRSVRLFEDCDSAVLPEYSSLLNIADGRKGGVNQVGIIRIS